VPGSLPTTHDGEPKFRRCREWGKALAPAAAGHTVSVKVQAWASACVFFKHEGAGAGLRRAHRFPEVSGA